MPLRHEKLVAWQKADDLYIVLHSLTRQRFPPDDNGTLEVLDRHVRHTGALVMGLLRAELKRVRSFSRESRSK